MNEWEAGITMYCKRHPGEALGNAGKKRSGNHTARMISMVLFFSLVFTSCAATAKSPVSETKGTTASTAESTSITSTTDANEPTTPTGETTTAKSDSTTTTKTTQPETQDTTAPTAPIKQAVPQSTPVPDSYFDDAVFIGNSITDTFMMYSGLNNATFYAATSLTVRSAYTKPVVKDNGSKITVMEAIKKHSYKKVYIMFGLNEVGWPATSVFVEEYGKLIDDVKKAQPNAVIYVQSILPVSAKKSQNDQYENNKNILKFNRLIQQVVKNEQVYYLNIHDSLIDANGCLPAEASTDGVHFNKKYCLKWLDYLKSHTVKS